MDTTVEYSYSTTQGRMAIRRERLSVAEYVAFLARTDLGKQYPKERFLERIGKLLVNTPISLIARNDQEEVIAVCLGLSDFAYWLMITDLGVDRRYVKLGLGSELMRLAREVAGGSDDIIVFINANEEAIPFYQKNGMEISTSMMELTDVPWTDFEVSTEMSVLE